MRAYHWVLHQQLQNGSRFLLCVCPTREVVKRFAKSNDYANVGADGQNIIRYRRRDRSTVIAERVPYYLGTKDD